MRSKMKAGVLCLMGATALAACQPPPSAEPDAKPAQSLNLEAPKYVAKVIPAKTAPKKGVTTARTTMPELKISGTISTTIAGCLVRDDGMFQLKDTDGEHAPRTRSWKSGFIRKGSATIDVIDAANRLKLGPHVGHRVSISGTLTDRELHAHAMRATSERCD